MSVAPSERGSYELATLFMLRVTGVPFDALDRVATPESAAAARRVLLAEKRKGEAIEEVVKHLVAAETRGKAVKRAQRALTDGARPELPPELEAALSAELAACLAAHKEATDARAELEAGLEPLVTRARQSLWESARTVLRSYAVFASTSMSDRFEALATSDGEVPRRDHKWADRERHWLLYLQRIAAKNDTFSEFGPSGWGTVDDGVSGLRISITPGISARHSFFERWVINVLVAAMNADPEVAMEAPPRLHPAGRLEGSTWIREDRGSELALDAADRDLLSRCDGATPPKRLGLSREQLERLVEGGVLVSGLQPVVCDALQMEQLVADVRAFGPGPARERWLEPIEALVDMARSFAQELDPDRRREAMDTAKQRLEDLGATMREGQRVLYAATNPIAEECARTCDFVLGGEVTRKVVEDATPWFDLWRDTYAFVASRVAARLRELLADAPRRDGKVALPAFLAHCESRGVPLLFFGLAPVAGAAYAEVRAALAAELASRPDADEWELTPDECRCLRRRLSFEPFDDGTYPSADFQIAAPSAEAVGRGEATWVLSELHTPIALLQHACTWSCPEPERLSEALGRQLGTSPLCFFGIGADGFPNHIVPRYFDLLPRHARFVAPHRGKSGWKAVRPADAEVYELGADVRVRRRDTGEDLGSIARDFFIGFGFHPFLPLHREDHTPRIRVGSVVVQRRSWTITADALGGPFPGVSPALVLAIERERAQRGWPRWVYARPTDRALARGGAAGRDKDVKPVFIDLESYLFLEVFARWLAKHGELELTEMLPQADATPWHEADGRRVFELRTLVLPKA